MLDKQKRAEAQWAARWTTYIETAVEPAFQDEFVGALNLPHASDPFPHLEQLLGEAKAQWSPERLLAFAALANSGNRQRGSREDREARRSQRTVRRATAES